MRKYRILIAEHDPPAPHRDLREILRSAGHKIADEAKDGLQAVEMAKRIRPDLVIMDIMMPRMDGIAASKRIGSNAGYAVGDRDGRQGFAVGERPISDTGHTIWNRDAR